MRVKNLIEQLKKCDPEADVYALCCDDDPLNGDGIDIKRVYQIDYCDGTPKAVYIDGTLE